MISDMSQLADGALEDERNAAERLLADMLIQTSTDPDTLAMRRLLAGWVTRRY
jgi:hypothetical protein